MRTKLKKTVQRLRVFFLTCSVLITNHQKKDVNYLIIAVLVDSGRIYHNILYIHFYQMKKKHRRVLEKKTQFFICFENDKNKGKYREKKGSCLAPANIETGSFTFFHQRCVLFS